MPTRPSLWVVPIELRLRHPHVRRVLLDFRPCRLIPRRVSKDAIVEDHHDLIVGIEIAVPAAVTQKYLGERALAKASVFSALTLNVDLGGF